MFTQEASRCNTRGAFSCSISPPKHNTVCVDMYIQQFQHEEYMFTLRVAMVFATMNSHICIALQLHDVFMFAAIAVLSVSDYL